MRQITLKLDQRKLFARLYRIPSPLALGFLFHYLGGENLLFLFAFLLSLDLVFNKETLTGKDRFRSRQEIDSSFHIGPGPNTAYKIRLLRLLRQLHLERLIT